MSSILFGTMPDGKEVNVYTITNKRGMSISAINYGGIITSIFVPDKNGTIADVVLGYDTLEGYLADTHYMGAIVGRCANRIAGAQFDLDGRQYNLVKNEGANSLHGGKKGFNKKWWHIQENTVREGTALRLTTSSLDGEEGYPGKLNVEVFYILTDNNELILRYTANCNKRTIVNLTNHSYYNLSAGADAVVESHSLQINTNYFLELKKDMIPTGKFIPVANTPLDFREPKKIGGGFDSQYEQVAIAGGIDHSSAVPTAKDFVVSYHDEKSGRVLEITTMEPSIQVYSGNFLNNTVLGKQNTAYQKHSGIAFETQHFPDSVHHSNFPTIILHPGKQYFSETRLLFTTR